MRKLIIIGLFLLCYLFAGPAAIYLNTARIAYFNEKDYARAKKACLEGIKKEPKNFELYTILGGSEIGLGNWQGAVASLIKALEIDSIKTIKWMNKRPEGESYYYQAFYFSARELFNTQKYDEALSMINYVKSPNINAYTLKGAILYKLGKSEEASKEYQKALDIDPENPDVNFLIGKVLFEGKAFDSSLYYFDVATMYYKTKFGIMAQLVFQNVLENKELVQNINKLWSENKLDELDQLIKKDLGFTEGLAGQKGNIEQFAKIADNLARSYYYVGMIYYNLKKDSLALNNLMKSLELNPDDLDALFFAGEALINLGKFQDALGFFEKVTQLKTDDQFAWFYIGVCYTQLKKCQEAINIYENKVLKLNPENIDAMTNLAALYSALGNKGKANEYLMRAEEIQKKKQ